jgi:hypothetical protein
MSINFWGITDKFYFGLRETKSGPGRKQVRISQALTIIHLMGGNIMASRKIRPYWGVSISGLLCIYQDVSRE